MKNISYQMSMNDAFLKKTFNRFLIPSMLSVLGGTINVLFDNLMLGIKLGVVGLASVSLCMPLYLVMCTMGSMIAAGGSILSATAIGKNKKRECIKIYGTSVTMLFILGIILSFAGIVFIDKIVGFLCSDVYILENVKSYAQVLIIGALPKMLMYIPFFYLPLDGKNKYCSILMLGMTAINIVLNYLFIFIMNMGSAGAASASVIATLISCVAGFMVFVKTKSIFRIHIYRPDWKLVFEIIKTGSPHALDNFCASIRLFLVNSTLISISGAVAVSIFAVINSLSEFSLCIINGVPQTAAPITAVYYSENNNIGVKLLLQRQLKTGLILITLYSIIVVAFSNGISNIFGIGKVGYIPFICLGISLILALVNNIMIYFYGRSRRILLADIITVCRLVVFVYVGIRLFANSGVGLWLFIPFGEIATIVIWILIAFIIQSKEKEVVPILLLNKSLELTGNVIDFSVSSTTDDICDASSRISDFCADNSMTLKQTMRISLAIEEILVIMSNKCFASENESFDVRVFSVSEKIGIRIRCMGKLFNPLENMSENENSDENMGIKLITDMADEVTYSGAFGANCLLIIFRST